MRHAGILSPVLSVALLAFGCGTSSSPTPNANEKVRDAGDATAEAAKAKRDEFALAMQKQLDELTAKYEELKGRAAKAEGQSRKDLEKKLGEAKARRDVAAQKLDELKAAGADRWEKVKGAVENAFGDLKKVFE